MKKNTENSCEEVIGEDWCFECKDGGNLRLCDYKDCPKAYHPNCVGKDRSFLKSKQDWNCRWHTCYLPECHRVSEFKCYCCPISVCGHCIMTAEFVRVKGKMGFCDDCLKLALLVEENKDVNSDGEVLDFESRETPEGLFREYWEIINETEGLTVEVLISANTRYRWSKSYNFISDGSEDDKVIEIGSDSDDMDTAVETQMPEMRRKRSKHRVYDHKRAHYCKKQTQSEDKEISYSSEDMNDNANVDCKRRKKSTADRISLKKETVPDIPRVYFAAIVSNNIKLIYLKQSLVEILSNASDTFESKVTGSFVRIKLHPKRNCYQLGQVTGITIGNEQNFSLQIAGMSNVSIGDLSDNDFSEEECEDLKNKVKQGLLKKLTVEEVEQKARSLREDIMNHWIPREIELLDHRADHANILGRRRMRFRYLEMKQSLQNPVIQSGLLQRVPEVIPEEPEPEDVKERDEGSPISIIMGASVSPGANLKSQRNPSVSKLSDKKLDTTSKVKAIVSLSEAERSYKGKTGEVISVSEGKETEKGGELQQSKVLVKLEKSTSVTRMSSASHSTCSGSAFSATELDSCIKKACKSTEGKPPSKKVVELPEKATGFNTEVKNLTDISFSDLKAETEMLKIKLKVAKRTTRKEMLKASIAEKNVDDLETKIKEMEEAKKKEIEEILEKAKEEEALKMSQMEEAHLKELEDVKESSMKAAAIDMEDLETKIKGMEEAKKKEIEEILEKAKEEEALKMSQMEEAHLKELEDVKESFMKAAAIDMEDLETKIKEMEEAKKKEIEEILEKAKEEEALKMSQMEEAHLKELEDVKESFMKAAAIDMEDLETKIKEMEEAKKKEIEEILEKAKEEEALKMSQMEEAHLKELEDVKKSYMNDVAIAMVETKIGMMEEFSKGYETLSLLSGETVEAGEVNSGVNGGAKKVSNPVEEAKV